MEKKSNNTKLEDDIILSGFIRLFRLENFGNVDVHKSA